MKKKRTRQNLCRSCMPKILLKMKLLSFFILISTFTTIAANSYSQQAKFNILLRNTTVREVLQKIEDSSEFIFLYSEKSVDVNRKVDVNVTNQTVDVVLDQLFNGTKNYYEIRNRQISILEKSSVELLSSMRNLRTESEQQPRSISGKVTDSSGSALPGATVVIKGTNKGTITDMDGKFTLTNVPSSAKTLVFSFIGMKTQEVVIGDKLILTVRLESESVGIEEVVAIGYGTMKKIDMTGSAASVSAQEIVKAPVKSFDEAIVGRIAGVQIVSGDGQPGSLPNIVIRGANSITQDNSPLYVIDGFPIEGNDNNAINANDIESIDVLKDASATAIYGARGANGVIMITTKRGKAGATVVSYNAYYGVSKTSNKIETLSPYEFVKLEIERSGTSATNLYLNNLNRTLDDYKTIEGIDWFDLCLQDAPMQNHDISIRGGNASSKYSVSASYFDQEGIFTNTGFRRWQSRVSLDQTINNKMSFGLNLNYSDTKNYGLVAASGGGGGGTGIMYSIWSYRPVFEDDINLDYDLMDPAVNPAQDYRTNPYLQLKNEHRETFSDNLFANSSFNYSITKELKLRITGGISKGGSKFEIFNNSKTATGNPASAAYKGINGNEIISNSINYTNENTLTWAKTFNKDHSINAVVGYSQQMAKSETFGASVVMITNEALGMNAMDEGSPNRVTASRSTWSLQSFLGRLNYNYKSKYLITASLRSDGSSKLAPGNRWGYFPSAAIAYRLSSENFMKAINTISDAKIRLSYGATGNNRVSDFAYMSSISSSYNDYSFGNAIPSPGSRATALGNADLKWETTKQLNVGIDIGLVKNRITFTGDYYYKRTSDLLLNAQIPFISGYSSTFKNIGSISNTGFELSINTKNIQKSDIKWTSDFNISFNKNKILSLTDGQESLISNGLTASPLYIAKVGKPIALFYGVIDDGLYSYDDFDILSNGDYVLKNNVPTNGSARASIKPGYAKFKDLNGDLVVNAMDCTIIGNPNPDFIGGFNNGFQYKGFDLNVFFQFSYGNEVYNANRVRYEGAASSNSYSNYFATYANRWTIENPTGNIPRVGGFGSEAFYPSRFVEDASFLRLKTLSLGYTLPSGLLKYLDIKTVRIYSTAQNIFTWTKYSGLDPEVSTRNTALTPGFDWSPYPRAKSIVFGINVTF